MKNYDVLYVGNYTKDTIISPAGTRYVDGGAINYAAHAAVQLGVKVAVVTRLAKEDDRVVEKFMASGIDCYVTYTPQSTLMKLEYPTTNPDIRNLSVTGIAGSITAGDVEDIRTRAAVIGTSLRGEVGIDVLHALKSKDVFVAADMQGFVRVLRDTELKYEPWDEMQSTLAQVDVVKSDAVEAEFLTGETDIYKAARFYAAMGPREIVLTHKDGLLIYADGKFHEMNFYPARLDGRSGRGDTCIGTYVARRLSLEPREAGIWAAAVTSLKMENLGPFNRSIDEVEAFIHAKYNHGSIL
ncbi:MAG TPA: PfkB family carbohydrate kinase [Anaerolineales bacterium]|nr:PfkB family carbohydrate kinase [Anaerolineales bacterium]HLO28847.1 PfkB family carbohydrate kinase [Anaerolineales bacterium]